MGLAPVSAIYAAQASFSKGEISPLLGSRADIDFWRQSLFQCRNWQVLTHGGIRRRSGTRYVATVKNSTALARLLPFRFSEEQSYVLALNDGYIRFLAVRGVVGSGGLPYQVAHPWADADLSRLSYAQFNDVAYFAHKGHEPEKLTRSAETSWALADAVFEDGPYLEANATGTTLTPADYGSLTPDMTGLTSPSGTVDSTGAAADAWRVFDKDGGTDCVWSGTTGFVSYQLSASATAIVDHYYVTATDGQNTISTPINWKIEGSTDGLTWVPLDSRQGESGWSGGETRFYDFVNKTAYSYHRFRWLGVDGSTGTRISEIGLNKAADSQTAFNLTASSITGINGGIGFQAADVGRHIRLQGSDGRWRWAVIQARTSTTVVTIKLYGPPLPDLSPIINWQLGAWSEETGWPGSVGLFNERLMWARTDEQPVTVWGSKQGEFEDYGVSDPAVSTDGISITLLSSNMNEVLWISDDEDLVTGSASQIRSVGPSDITQSFSATNITQRKGPTSGARHIQPISIGGVVLYVAAGGTKIRELVLGEQNRYVAPELSLIGEHFFKGGIVDWAFAEKPDPTIYCVTGDGLLVAVTYDREQRVVGFARHDVGGTVESVAVIPGTTAGHDDLYMVVQRTINGSSVRYVEVLEKPFGGDVDGIEDAFHVDCGVTYSGVAATTITGLSHLEGEAVAVLADGGVVSGLTVSGGQIILPNEASKVQIGLPMISRAITLPVAGPVSDGTLFGRRTSITAVHADTLHAGSLKVGAYGSDEWEPMLYEQILPTGGELFGNAITLKTGFTHCQIEGSWAEGSGQIVMEVSDPLPAIVRSLVLQIEHEP
jgi:hypothetical protein